MAKPIKFRKPKLYGVKDWFTFGGFTIGALKRHLKLNSSLPDTLIEYLLKAQEKHDKDKNKLPLIDGDNGYYMRIEKHPNGFDYQAVRGEKLVD